MPVPGRCTDAPFLMAVENCMTITGRGTVVTGAVERGQVRAGDPVELIGLGAAVRSVATSVETFGKMMEAAEAGDNAALLLRGVGRHQVRRGQVLAAPGLRCITQSWRVSMNTGNCRVVLAWCWARTGYSATSFGQSSARAAPASSSARTVKV